MSQILKLPKFVSFGCLYVVMAILVFLWLNHGNNEDHHRYGSALPGEVYAIGQSGKKNGDRYTKVAIEVITPDHKHHYYPSINLEGRPRVGHNVRAWFYNGDPHIAAFEHEYDPDTPSHFPTYPWYSWFTVSWLSLIVAIFPMLFLLGIWLIGSAIFESLKLTSAEAKKRGLREARSNAAP